MLRISATSIFSERDLKMSIIMAYFKFIELSLNTDTVERTVTYNTVRLL